MSFVNNKKFLLSLALLGFVSGPLWADNNQALMQAIGTSPLTSNTVADIAELAAPSVVSLEISVKGKRAVPTVADSRDYRGGKIYRIVPKLQSVEAKVGDGSGFIISPDGYIVTNQHLVLLTLNKQKVRPSKIEVILYDGKRYVAEVVGEDEDSDIAVLKIKANNLRPIKWADSSLVRPGEFALTIGSSLGADHTVGFGIISAVSRKKPQGSKEAFFGDLDYIQTYAQINPGNSGGPLINLKGEVLGITSFIEIAPHSPGFAIPANYAKNIVTALIKDKKVHRPAVGIYLSNLKRDVFSADNNNELTGALVEEVMPDGPSDKAGIKEGDVITKINNITVDTPQDFTHEIRSNPVNTTFNVEVYRQERKLNLKVTSEYLD
jgi:serine protease Do